MAIGPRVYSKVTVDASIALKNSRKGSTILSKGVKIAGPTVPIRTVGSVGGISHRPPFLEDYWASTMEREVRCINTWLRD